MKKENNVPHLVLDYVGKSVGSASKGSGMKVTLEKRSLTHANRKDLDFLIYETEIILF